MRVIGLAAALSVATPVLANHPGDNLNQMIAAKEAAFEAVAPRPAPVSEWTDNAGDVVGMEELKGKIVAVSFAPSDCGAPCV
ncbi:MAG: protein SCO1/2, partial [Sulfitobacter pontiacus]